MRAEGSRDGGDAIRSGVERRHLPRWATDCHGGKQNEGCWCAGGARGVRCVVLKEWEADPSTDDADRAQAWSMFGALDIAGSPQVGPRWTPSGRNRAGDVRGGNGTCRVVDWDGIAS